MNFIKANARIQLVCLVALVVVCAVNTTAIARDLPDFTELVEEYRTAVVNISTTQKVKHPPIQKQQKILCSTVNC